MLTLYITFTVSIEKQNFSLKYAAKRNAFCLRMLTARYQRRLSFRPPIKLSKKRGAESRLCNRFATAYIISHECNVTKSVFVLRDARMSDAA